MDINHDAMEDRLSLINNENHNFTSVVALTCNGCVVMVLVTQAQLKNPSPKKQKTKNSFPPNDTVYKILIKQGLRIILKFASTV